MHSQITTLTIFTFAPNERFWAFSQMALARRHLLNVQGLEFYKLMGAGRGIGFTREPDWGRYAFLGVWEREENARTFMTSSAFMQSYQRHAERVSTLYLHTLHSHGTWNRKEPFREREYEGEGNGEVAILTRASIRPERLKAFWKMVGPVSNALETAEGLRGSIGIGEFPLIRQATFSVWKSLEEMKAFAYKSTVHRDVIRRTRSEAWYQEDLFARFAVIDQVGKFP